MLSAHWFDLTEPELRFLGLLARQAADLIEYQQIACIAQSAERMRRAISVEAVVTVFFNVQGRVNAANDTFLRTSRYSREELEQEEMRA